MGTARDSSWDWARRILSATGIGWLTPFVGKQDKADLEYLRASIVRDLHSLDTLLRDGSDDLKKVAADLAALGGVGGYDTSTYKSPYKPIAYPWHVPSGWTDYGAVRLAMLGALPEKAHAGAVAELGAMQALVLPSSRLRWAAQLAQVEQLISAQGTPDDPSIPYRLQALWREIDFGRNYWRIRVAKNTTITSILWTLLVGAVVTTVLFVRNIGEEGTKVWLVALLGLFGGTISALRSTNLPDMPERRSIEVESVRLRLRPVVGAAMAVILYIIGRSGLVFQLVKGGVDTAAAAGTSPQAPVQIHVPDIAWGYYALSFVAGFAERWFLKILELAEGRIVLPTPTTKPPGSGGGGDHQDSGGGQSAQRTTDKKDSGKADVGAPAQKAEPKAEQKTGDRSAAPADANAPAVDADTVKP